MAIRYTKEDATRIVTEVGAPYVTAYLSTLGGEGRESIMISISLEPKEKWNFGILQNSNYAMFAMHGGEDKLECHSGSRFLKFRKAKIKSVDDAIAKLQKWVDGSKIILDKQTGI